MKKKPLLDILINRYPDIKKKELFARVLCGEVLVQGERVKDPQRLFQENSALSISRPRYVSRGGVKLAYALKEWNYKVEGKVFLDAGCSTGGFTDCLLQHGALKVHAVDVGYNQLAFSLRRDPRVIVHERTNIMDIYHLKPVPYAAVADLSFRSITGAALKILSLTSGGECLALIKPQFEVRDSDENFNGVIKSREIRKSVVLGTLEKLYSEGSYPHRILISPIQGKKGNQEFLLLLKKGPGPTLPEITEQARKLL